LEVPVAVKVTVSSFVWMASPSTCRSGKVYTPELFVGVVPSKWVLRSVVPASCNVTPMLPVKDV
jgi:hypothetical protein